MTISRGIITRSLRSLGSISELTIMLILLGMCIFLALVQPRFTSLYNLRNVLRQVSTVAIIGCAEMFPLLVGGIDISIGSIIGVVSVVTVLSIGRIGFIPGVMCGVLLGGFLGLVNGFVIGKLKVNPFVTTLGMLSAGRGLAMVVTNGRPVFKGLPPSFLVFGVGYIGPIPVPVLITLIIFVILYILLGRTRFGRYIYAIGSNPEAARLSGVSVGKHIIAAYAISGLLAGLAGLVLSSRVNSGQPNLGVGMELDAIAAAVIGGVSLGGGKGTLLGVFLGALVLAILRNGLNLLNVSSYLQLLLIGIVLVVAVTIDRVRRGTQERAERLFA